MTRPRNAEVERACNADILAQVRISDAPQVMQLHELAPEVQAEIAKARSAGFNPVSLRWPDGEFALVFCQPGHVWPNPDVILAAYRQCTRNSKTFPEGEMSWKP